MNVRIAVFVVLGLLGGAGCALAADEPPVRQRIFVLTDIENEPDDAMSLVRFLVYSNHFDVEGLAATTSIHQKNQVAAWRIREILDAYAKVRDNLALHEPGYPAADQLRAGCQQPQARWCPAL